MDSKSPKRCDQAFGCDYEHFQRSRGLFQNEWFNLLINHNTMGFLGDINCKRWGLVWGSRSLGDMSWRGLYLILTPFYMPPLLPSSYHDTNCSAPPCPSCHGALVALKLCGTPTTHTVSKFSSLAKQNNKNWSVYQAQDWGESSENCQDEEQLILSRQGFCS